MRKQFITVVLAASVSIGSFAALSEPAHAASSTGIIVSSVNFRSEPSTSSKTFGTIKKGEQVDILSKVNSWWYKVKDDQGRIGYVSANAKYIKVPGTIPTASKPVSSGTSSSSAGTSSSAASISSDANKVINAGKKYLGTPYEYGSSRSDTSTFDCSDFVRQAFKDGLGITLPADSRSQGQYVKNLGKTTTDWTRLKPGDLMFFMEYRGTSSSSYPSDKSSQRITHDGIYLGNGKILHTYSKASGGVRISSIEDTHWEKRFIFGGSAIK